MSTEVYGTDAGGNLVVRRVLLRVATGPNAGDTLPLQQGTVLIGTGPGADLRLTDGRVSRSHVELAMTRRGIGVKDLGSTNGTFVGTTQISAVVIQPPAAIRLGETRIDIIPDDLPAPAVNDERDGFGAMVGASRAMRSLFGLMARVAPTDVSVLIEGEPGVGKSAAAAAIHGASPRARADLVVVDFAASNDAASVERAVAEAARGTLLLERVDLLHRDTALALLASLDRAERDGRDVRTLSTSATDTRALLERGALPRELFFHLAGVRVVIPPLRERPEDVSVIVRAIAAGVHQAGDVALSAAETLRLRAHELPGNVRELRSLVEEAILVSRTPDDAHPGYIAPAAPTEASSFKDAKDRVLAAFEREYLRNLLERHDDNLSAAAREAGVVRHHLLALAKKHGLR
jgi:DNA-binding NtrC family response regulator